MAPARDLEVGKAAIDAGADAVYIGAPEFGARQAASNSIEDILQKVLAVQDRAGPRKTKLIRQDIQRERIVL